MVHRGALAATAGAVSLGVTVGLWPAAARMVPPCPVHAATGLDCPGCGMTRAVAALARGDLAAALGHNAVAVGLLLPLLAVVWWSWVRRRPVPAVVSSGAFLPVLLGLVGVFTLARNLPWAPLAALAA